LRRKGLLLLAAAAAAAERGEGRGGTLDESTLRAAKPAAWMARRAVES
jgi:hypothetical protein